MLTLFIALYILRFADAFPNNLFGDKDLKLFRPMTMNLRGDQILTSVPHEFVIRFNEQYGFVWIENLETKEEHVFCDRNSTITTSIRSPSKHTKHSDPRRLFPTKVCLFDGLCNADTPEFGIMTFNKLDKTIVKANGQQSKVYQFQSEWNYYLDIDSIDYYKYKNDKINKRVKNQNVRLCRLDESYQQLFQIDNHGNIDGRKSEF